MQEKEILIEGLNPVDILGVRNTKLDHLAKYFPKVKLVARGNKVRVIGPEHETTHFEEVFKTIINYFTKYNKLSESDIDVIASDVGFKMSESKPDEILVYGNGGIQVKAKTVNQRKMVSEIANNDLMFAIGPAGTGKTYTAVALAVRALKNKEVKRIILTRPAVEAGEHLGFLPGDLKEKLDPYLQPLYDGLRDMIPKEKLAEYVENGVIQIAPLAFMRGRTLDKAFVILDEAQNATEAQLKMFLTRMGRSAKFVITGDETQVDLPKHQPSGLAKALKILDNIDGISIVRLDGTDVIRHKLVKKVIQAFEKS